MPSRRPELPSHPGEHLPEAVAQWQLTLRTEVKAASALPTAMFHTRDAMLETLLAETNETMLARLHEPDSALARPASAGEQRIEVVEPAELQALPARIREGDAAAIDVDDHLLAESIAVLADACCSGHAASAAGAVWLLRRLFEIEPEAAADAAAVQVLHCLQQALLELPRHAEQLAAFCHRIAAAVASHPAAVAAGDTP